MPWPAASLVMNPIEHEKDELGRRDRSNHQMDALNHSNMRLCNHYIRIPNVLIQRYVNSMRRRTLLSIRKNECHTGY